MGNNQTSSEETKNAQRLRTVKEWRRQQQEDQEQEAPETLQRQYHLWKRTVRPLDLETMNIKELKNKN